MHYALLDMTFLLWSLNRAADLLFNRVEVFSFLSLGVVGAQRLKWQIIIISLFWLELG